MRSLIVAAFATTALATGALAADNSQPMNATQPMNAPAQSSTTTAPPPATKPMPSAAGGAAGARSNATNPTAPAANKGAMDTSAKPGMDAKAGMPDATPATAILQGKQADQWMSSKIVGATVYSKANKKIGDVNNLLVSSDGKVDGVVVGVGGFLGVGEKNVALDYRAVTIGKDKNGNVKVTVDVSKEALNNAPAFKGNDNG